MNVREYTVGDRVLVRHFTGNFQATVISVGESRPFWGARYVLRGPVGEFDVYANELVEPGDYDFIF